MKIRYKNVNNKTHTYCLPVCLSAPTVGTYWGVVSSKDTTNVVESSDLVLCVGVVPSDYSTCGWTGLATTPSDRRISVGVDHVDACGSVFSDVFPWDLLPALQCEVMEKPASRQAYQRIHQKLGSYVSSMSGVESSDKLSMRELQRLLPSLIDESTDLFVDIGDAWFIVSVYKTLTRDIHLYS